MSFEKEMKKRGNQKLDAFAKNPYHQETPKVVEPKRKSFPTWAKVMIPSFAVATCLVVFMVPIIMMGGMKNAAKPAGGDNYAPADIDGSRYEDKEASQNDNQQSGTPQEGSQTYTVPTWNEATIIEQYPEFIYQEVRYNIRYNDSQPIDSQYINIKLADITVNGYDIYERVNHEIDAEVYSIKNIALDASLAIKFSGNEDYYAYQNIDCCFADIGELLNKMSFASEVYFPEVYYNHYDENNNYSRITYHNAQTAKIIEILFDDVTIKNNFVKPRIHLLNNETSEPSETSNGSQNPNSPLSSVTLLTAIPALGIDNAGIQLYENGSLYVNLFGSLATFDLLDDKYQSLVTYIVALN